MNLNSTFAKSMNLNLVFSKSMNSNLVFSKSKNLNLNITKKMNVSTLSPSNFYWDLVWITQLRLDKFTSSFSNTTK